MSSYRLIHIVSDLHYAGPGEQARPGHEPQAIPNPLLRALVRAYRHFVWLRDPLAMNHLVDRFLDEADPADLVVANGDYCVDTAFVGVSDDAACESVGLLLQKFRQRFPGRFAATIGDHELGKMSIFGGRGGMRVASWRRACEELGLTPFWRIDLGRYVLLGVASPLIALPIYEAETLPEERPVWETLRHRHLGQLRQAFRTLQPHLRILLFCHDPSALPFLWREPAVRERLGQFEFTIVGHLHTRLVYHLSRGLAGMPQIRFLGNTARRLTQALREAKYWRPFRVRLCPALAGVELLKDGGYCALHLDLDAVQAPQLRFHPLPRRASKPGHGTQLPGKPGGTKPGGAGMLGG
ncbi:MAG: hypothetical protein FJ387_05515 [Verrucomicrobia bacterium]|nr:hypothetical protein [Verrucomicrobiota bacterium]